MSKAHSSRGKTANCPISTKLANLYNAQNGKCYYCQRFMSISHTDEHRATIDHYYPKSKHKNAEHVLVGACWLCNNTKGDLMPEEFEGLLNPIVALCQGKMIRRKRWDGQHFIYFDEEKQDIVDCQGRVFRTNKWGGQWEEYTPQSKPKYNWWSFICECVRI